MRLLRIAFGALGGVVLATSSALAADIAAIPPPPVWGFYFGGGVCYDWADFDIDKTTTKETKKKQWQQVGTKTLKIHKHTYTIPIYGWVWIPQPPIVGTKHYEGKAEGPCLTATFGYDYQIDPLWVIGAFASYDWQKKEGDIFKVGHPDYPKGDVWLGDIFTVAGRAGMLVTPTVLVYAVAGWSWSKAGFELDKDPSGPVSGPTIGGGIEALLQQNWSIRGEYRWTDFGSLSGTGTCGSSCTTIATANITDQSVRLVLTYRP